MPITRHKLQSSGAIVIRTTCEVCGESAPFGDDVFPRANPPRWGRWFCFAHWRARTGRSPVSDPQGSLF